MKHNAQNQHYVSKFMLRNFLSDPNKEQVTVYDKHKDRVFVTSIRNIMAERRFNDFVDDEWIVSFEPVVTEIENLLISTYKGILDRRCLSRSAQEIADLAFLIAFQFIRTKASRERFREFDNALTQNIEARGFKMEQVKGWSPLDDEQIKLEQLKMLRGSMDKFADALVSKDFVLMEATAGRSFYLSDNPVCLHNQRKFGPYGNIGLSSLPRPRARMVMSGCC